MIIKLKKKNTTWPESVRTQGETLATLLKNNNIVL